MTDDEGRYRLGEVPFGNYLVRVRRLGYRPTQVRVRLGQRAPFRVSVAMEVLPIVLEPEHVTAQRQTFRNGSFDHLQTARIAAYDAQRATFLSADVRILTHLDLVESTTFGETDLFRAMQYLPGVASRDDYTAELWTRGAPWSHTRVLYDGMPLYNPLHTSGVFSAINPDALGTVIFQPGGRSARIGEGAAGVIQLESRPASDTTWSGRAEVSPVSARLSFDRRFSGGRGGFMFAVRRSYIDVLMRTVADVTNDPGIRFPYAFADGAARVELPLGSVAMLDLSGVFEQDQLLGDVRNIIRDSEGSWGNLAGRASLTLPVGALLTRHTIGGTRFRGAMSINNPFAEFADSIPSHSRMDNRLDYGMWETLIQPGFARGPLDWTAGIQLISERQFYDGPFPRPYPSNVVFDSLRLTETRFTKGLWGEVRAPIGAHMEVDVGFRVELSDSALEQGTVALYPRLAWRFTPAGGTTTVSASYARSFQYSQAVAPAGPGIGPDLHLTDVWLLAGSAAPPIGSTVFSVSTERRFGTSWLANLTVYSRVAEGVAVPDPEPGRYATLRPVFVSAVNRARGVEVSARKIAGRWHGTMTATFNSSRMESRSAISQDLYEYPAASDRRVVVNGTVGFQLTESLRLGGAAAVASGAPFTRFVLQTLPCDSMVGPCPPHAGFLSIEEPNANRAPTYASASVMGEWRKAFSTWELGVYIRVRNILNRRNAVTYTGSLGGCEVVPEDAVAVRTRTAVCDLFNRGLPLLPLAGVNIAF